MNIFISFFGFLFGFLVLKNHLSIFDKHAKTPTVDTWLVFVGTLAWSLALFAEVYQHSYLPPEELFARVLFFVFWCGQLLKIKRYCFLLKKHKLKRGLK